MQLATVIGHTTSTARHPSLSGWRTLVVQPLDAAGQPDGAPLIAIDDLGSGRGDRVMLSSDGAAVREMVDSDTTPVRWAVIGIADD